MSRSASTVAFLTATALLCPPQLSYASPTAPQGSVVKPEEAKAKPSAEELSFEEIEYEKGLTFYKAGDYERAVASFVKVYRVAPNPNLIYNIARCFEELKRFGEAADSYEEYLKLSPEASDRPQVEVTIKTLRSLASAKASSEASTASEPPAPQPKSNALELGLLGAGAVLMTGGVWYGLEAGSAADRRDEADTKAQFNNAQSDMSSAALRADVLLIGGALVATTGVILMLTSSDEAPSAEPQSGVQLSLSPRHVALTWQF